MVEKNNNRIGNLANWNSEAGALKYRALFQNMREGLLVLSIEKDKDHHPIDYTICDINKSCLRIFDAKYEEVINKSIRDVFPNIKATKPFLLHIFSRCINEKEPIDIEVQVEKSFLWYKLYCFTAEGYYLYVSIQDITERKKSNAEIQKLYYAIEQSSSAVLISDYEGYIEYVNPKFEEVTGYSLQEIKGNNPNMLISEMSSQNYKELQHQITNGREWKGELLNKKKNGESYWALVSISPIRNKSGEIVNFIAVEEDISEIKALHKNLELKNEQLTEALEDLKNTQSRLVQNEKLAGIGQLAAGVAHEINNPLGFVSSNFEILKKYMTRYQNVLSDYTTFKDTIKEKDYLQLSDLIEVIEISESQNKIAFVIEDMAELFREIEDGIERIKKIVQGLRNFSRVDYLDNFEEYDINAGIETTLIVANNEIKYFANVERDLGELPAIYANGSQVNQVILNILINAVHAIKSLKNEQPGTIKIRTRYDERYVYCEIEDNGIGMNEDVKNHIFEPFYSTKEVGEGTGLGLSISYDIIVNKHKGDISITSQFNKGSTFTIKLPRLHLKNKNEGSS